MASSFSSITCADASSLVSEIVLMTTAKTADNASTTPTAFLNLISDVGDFITSLFLFKLDLSSVCR